jgi:DNA-binding CsgD family transcriptional regulator
MVEPLTTDQAVGPAWWMVHEERCWVDLYAGRLGAATDRLEQIRRGSGQRSVYEKSDLARLRIELALWSNDPEAAVDLARRAVEGLAGVAPEGWAARLLTTAMWACADLVEDASVHRDETRVHAGRRFAVELEAVRDGLLWDPFAEHPFFLTLTTEGREWAAERSRCHGGNEPEMWLELAQEWETFNRPHRAGYAWWRAAQALLQLGRRGPAASALQLAHRYSDQHVPLTDAVTHLALLSRSTLETPATAPDTLNQRATPPLAYGLTGRELDVLGLLTKGLTNAEIGSCLYISPKTASVHVTAILRKLQATNRVQAATIAERLGLTST